MTVQIVSASALIKGTSGVFSSLLIWAVGGRVKREENLYKVFYLSVAQLDVCCEDVKTMHSNKSRVGYRKDSLCWLFYQCYRYARHLSPSCSELGVVIISYSFLRHWNCLTIANYLRPSALCLVWFWEVTLISLTSYVLFQISWSMSVVKK